MGISMVRQWTDESFATKADNAFEKIQAVLPAELQGELQQITTWSMPAQDALPWTVSFSSLRECIRVRRKIHIEYRDKGKRTTSRTLRPLALFFFSPAWLLAGWCEKRNDFRHFRLDRIDSMQYCEDTFDDEKNKNLTAYMAREEACVAELN